MNRNMPALNSDVKFRWAFCRIVVTRRSRVRGDGNRHIPASVSGRKLLRSYIKLQNSSRILQSCARLLTRISIK